MHKEIQINKYIKNIWVIMVKTKGIVVPVCPVCKRKTIYFRTDGSIRCRACGYDGPLEIKND